jgi:hypothetical protein
MGYDAILNFHRNRTTVYLQTFFYYNIINTSIKAALQRIH